MINNEPVHFSLKYLPLLIRLRCCEPARLPGYLGSTLHGILGWALLNHKEAYRYISVSYTHLRISQNLIHDLGQLCPGVLPEGQDLVLCLDMIEQMYGYKFIFLIDEWDCVFRFHKGKKKEQEEFLSFLKLLFKDKSYVELVYMTGILPIKKYNTGSALNMFREYTMLEPKKLAPYFGFTENEICLLYTSRCV